MVMEIRRYIAPQLTTTRGWSLVAAIVCVLPSCSTDHSLSKRSDAKPAQSSVDYANCILPGQLRQLGTRLTYLTPRQPVELSEKDCRSRGGQFIVGEQTDPQPKPAAGAEIAIRWGNKTRSDSTTVYSVAGEVVVSDKQ
jgi:hypothetical protein